MRRLALHLALLSASSLAALGLAEIALRYSAHLVLSPGEWVAVGQIFEEIDPPIGFSLRPDSTQLLVSGGAYTSRASINAAGMRDVERAEVAAPGISRVLVLGDSFMFGQGVRLEDAMPRRLEALLPGVEVINAAVPGYDLGQAYLYYTERGRRYRPDLVLLGFFINDLAPARELDVTLGPDGVPLSYARKAEMVDRDRLHAPRGITGAVSSWLRARSLLYVLVRKRLDPLLLSGRRRPPAPTPEEREAETPYLAIFTARSDESGEEELAWTRGYRTLDALKRGVEADGARLALVLVPAPFQLTDPVFAAWRDALGATSRRLERRAPQDHVLAWCAASGIACHDLLPEFEPKDRDRLFFPHDLHWTAEGHDLAARSVAAFLQANGLP